jgi:hypothetical protein
VLRALGSVGPGQVAALGPLHFAAHLPDLTPSPRERAALDQLRDEEAIQKALGQFEAKEKTLTLTLRLPTDAPEALRLAAQVLAPYAEMALDSTYRYRVTPRPPPDPGAGKAPKDD